MKLVIFDSNISQLDQMNLSAFYDNCPNILVMQVTSLLIFTWSVCVKLIKSDLFKRLAIKINIKTPLKFILRIKEKSKNRPHFNIILLNVIVKSKWDRKVSL